MNEDFSIDTSDAIYWIMERMGTDKDEESKENMRNVLRLLWRITNQEIKEIMGTEGEGWKKNQEEKPG